MAAYREHISVSGFLGVSYGAAAMLVFGFTPVQGTLVGILTWVAGMFPDLDSETGRPVREIFGLLAAAVPFLMMRQLIRWSGDLESAVLLALGIYAFIKYVASYFLGKITVHRGMFHSVPALVIASELTFLTYQSPELSVRFMMASGVGLGFFSHLLLDEMYSVQWNGVRPKLNKSAGTALKMSSKDLGPNVVTYALLGVLTYASMNNLGFVQDGAPTANTTVPPAARQAIETVPERL